MSAFFWDAKLRRYRDENSKLVPTSQIITARDAYVAGRSTTVRDLAASLAEGHSDVKTWLSAMRDEVRNGYLAQYLLGRGGLKAMQSDDYQRLGNSLKSQYVYLQSFAEDVRGSQLSEAQIGARSELYLENATGQFDRARAAAWDLALPVYPCDHGTSCKSRCHCYWSFRLGEDNIVVAKWTISPAENCVDCLNRSITYERVPFIVA